MEPLRADGAPDNSAGPHKDVTFGGVPPLAESDWRTGGDATRRMAAINWFLHATLEILLVFVAPIGSAAEASLTGRKRFHLNVSPARVRHNRNLEKATARVAAFNLPWTFYGICLRCVKYIL